LEFIAISPTVIDDLISTGVMTDGRGLNANPAVGNEHTTKGAKAGFKVSRYRNGGWASGGPTEKKYSGRLR